LKRKDKKKKIALITNIIAPYRVPCFNKIIESDIFNFDVYFLAENESNREWKIYRDKIKFHYKVLKGVHFKLRNERILHLNYGLAYYLVKQKYDLIAIGGWDQVAYWEALIISKILGTKIMYFGESTLKDRRSNSQFFEKMKRVFIKNCDGYLPAGNAAAEYVKYLGGSPDKIFIARFCADHDFFYNEYLRLRPYKKEIKRKKGYPAFTILFVGRFVWYKGVMVLLEAYKKLQEKNKDIGLVLLGDGPEREKYEKYCKSNNLKNVFFEGFKQMEELPEYYISADVLVLPSLSDPWGLVVNEAMAFGLPVISTDVAGVTYDLVKNGINGYVVKAGNVKDLYKALKKLYKNENLRKKMGEMSLEIIKEYTPENWAKSFIEAINKILNK